MKEEFYIFVKNKNVNTENGILICSKLGMKGDYADL